jgi:hypothetical protein
MCRNETRRQNFGGQVSHNALKTWEIRLGTPAAHQCAVSVLAVSPGSGHTAAAVPANVVSPGSPAQGGLAFALDLLNFFETMGDAVNPSTETPSETPPDGAADASGPTPGRLMKNAGFPSGLLPIKENGTPDDGNIPARHPVEQTIDPFACLSAVFLANASFRRSVQPEAGSSPDDGNGASLAARSPILEVPSSNGPTGANPPQNWTALPDLAFAARLNVVAPAGVAMTGVAMTGVAMTGVASAGVAPANGSLFGSAWSPEPQPPVGVDSKPGDPPPDVNSSVSKDPVNVAPDGTVPPVSLTDAPDAGSAQGRHNNQDDGQNDGARGTLPVAVHSSAGNGQRGASVNVSGKTGDNAATASQPSSEHAPPAAASPKTLGIGLRLNAGSDASVSVQLIDRNNALHVAVRTPDPDLAHRLQDHLNDLVGSLKHAGVNADTWTPPAPEAQSADNGNTGSRNREQPFDGGSGSRQGGESGQRGRQQQERRPPWVESLDDNFFTSFMA